MKPNDKVITIKTYLLTLIGALLIWLAGSGEGMPAIAGFAGCLLILEGIGETVIELIREPAHTEKAKQ
jgi:hypothetical protein